MPVNLFQHGIGSPAAALHNIGVRDTECVLYRGAVVAQVMETKMWQSRARYDVDKAI